MELKVLDEVLEYLNEFQSVKEIGRCKHIDISNMKKLREELVKISKIKFTNKD